MTLGQALKESLDAEFGCICGNCPKPSPWHQLPDELKDNYQRAAARFMLSGPNLEANLKATREALDAAERAGLVIVLPDRSKERLH